MEIFHGDCRTVLPQISQVDAVITDPPYGLSFMGKGWDHGVPGVEFWKLILEAMKPGAHLLAFGGTRTFHRLTCAIEDAGFEIRDCVMWVYGSGFPKSLDVSKAIDRQRYNRAQVYEVTAWITEARDQAGRTNGDIDDAFGFHGMAGHWTSSKSQPQVPTLEQIPTLLGIFGLTLDDVPDDIRNLVWTLNGLPGQPGKAWYQREVIGKKKAGIATPGDVDRYTVGGSKAVEVDITLPTTDAAKQWDGWGTALKPAWEPIILARKPLEGTVAANVLEHGVGGLNVDGCRVGTEEMNVTGSDGTIVSQNRAMAAPNTGRVNLGTKTGRWPANLIHDGSEEVVGLFPETKSQVRISEDKDAPGVTWSLGRTGITPRGHADSGSAARFFYCSKASKKDRGEGNQHPCVKPTDLMRYLCRLVTPPGGMVLDPFMGSGSTGKAALLEGFGFVGIDQDGEYCEVARRRLTLVEEEVLKDLLR